MRSAARFGYVVLAFAILIPFRVYAAEPLKTPTGGVLIGLPPAPSEVAAGSRSDLVNLGQRLFNEKLLSKDQTISCATCHIPSLAFASHEPRSQGFNNRMGTRNAPSLLNVAYNRDEFWDGRSNNLESQSRLPLVNPAEHGFDDEEQLIQMLNQSKSYESEFRSVFRLEQNKIDISQVERAIAAYERTLLAGCSAFDRYMYSPAPGAMSVAAVRGLALFRGRGRCSQCHLVGNQSALFTDQQYHLTVVPLPPEVTSHLPELVDRVIKLKRGRAEELNVEIATDPEIASLGRFLATLNPADIGQFRTPALRNVALTAPYMHDGSVPTLAQAVNMELYDRSNDNPIVMSQDEKLDLIEFLNALTSGNFTVGVKASASNSRQ